VNIDTIVDAIDVPYFLNSLGIDYEPAMRDEVRFICPWHDETQPSLYFNINRKIFHCLGCSRKGTLLQFLKEYRSISTTQAIDYLVKFANIDCSNKKFESISLTDEDKENREFVKKMVRLNDNAPLEEINIEWFKNLPIENIPYLEQRGFTLKTLSFFELKIGSFKEGKRIIIPIGDDKGRLVGYSLRKMNDDKEKKYKHKANMQKHKIIYNLCSARHELDKFPLMICEGFSDVWKAYQCGYLSAVAIMGKELSDKQEDLILQYAYEIIIAPDNDEPGIQGAADMIRRLQKFVKIKLLVVPKGKDIGDLTESQFKKCLGSLKEIN